MGANMDYNIQLKEKQYQFLQDIKERYYMPDESKALRCLINFAIDNPDLESKIFEEIRCFDC